MRPVYAKISKMKVKIYSTTHCPYCKMEKMYLDQKGVPYEEILVDLNEKAAEEMVGLSGQLGVPFTVISKDDGTEAHILGFDQPKLNQALNIV